MTRSASILAVVAFLAVPVAGLAADTGPAKVMAGANGKKFYTDAQGMTLYVFDKDEKGKSSCTGDCAAAWPPLKAEASSKATGDWSIIARADGTKQWAYEGKPVYTFVKDKKAGDVTGDDFKKVWHVVQAD
jgi:predicted lipoprotein with Yx(FWY)xxD motif